MTPSLSDLTARYLASHGERLDANAVAETPAVTFYDAVPPHAIDAKLAWAEATAVLTAFGQTAPAKAVPGWANVVAAHDAITAVPMAVGNYPQMVRDLGALLDSRMTTPAGSPIDDTAFGQWAAKADDSAKLLVAGLLRSARHYDAASAILAANDRSQPVWANEYAALLWDTGRHGDAAAIWATLPDCPPVRFNRGVAALFVGDMAGAVGHFRAAVGGLPESSGWHHLARLYLEVAGE